MVEWEELTVDEAMFLFDYLGKHADLDEEGTPEELDPSEAMVAFETLEAFDEMGGMPECGDEPEGLEDLDVAGAFALIDQDGSGSLSEKEGMDAMFCLVEWDIISVSEAHDIFEHIGEFVGEDGEVQLEELEAAHEAWEEGEEEE